MLSTLFSFGARSALSLAAGVCLLGLTGCADPDAAFDDFTQRYLEIHPPIPVVPGCGHEACTPPTIGANDGDFLMALSAKINPTKPVILLATVTTTASGSGLGVSLKLQPLKADDRRTPTGEALDAGPFDVDANGQFSAQLPTLTVPGDANPITPGNPIEATAALCGHICGDEPDLVCGEVSGNVTKPIMLPLADANGTSTFAFVRISDPASYPEPMLKCPDPEGAAP
jgi:hypothetical protein